MFNIKLIYFALCYILCVKSVISLWDFAVTTKNKIIFYDDKWSILTTAAHQFDELSAIAFDETDEEIYFNDMVHNNGSIFSLKLNNGDNHITDKILSRSQNETISGITFDPLDRILYWTDSENKKIYRMLLENNTEHFTPQILFDFSNEETIPDGIAIDVCRRKLYWTNSNHKNPSIERASLNGNKHEVIVKTDLFLPHGIVVDQSSHRIFWVDDQQGSHFSVESANLDGTNRLTIVKSLNNVPFNLAVTKNSIFWTDLIHNAVWSISKTPTLNERPSKVQSFEEKPKGILARTNFLSRQENDVDCKDIVKHIKAKLLTFHKTSNEVANKHSQKPNIFCLNNGDYNAHSGTCICKIGYTGSRCQTSECHNFCVHGTCSLSTIGFPQCTCQEGAFGERCETHKCNSYCLNNGICQITDGEPQCLCSDTHFGLRCENNITAICGLVCQNQSDALPSYCYENCGGNNENHDLLKKSYKDGETNYKMCNDTYNKTVIIIVIGVLTALTLVFLIIQSIRKLYKPVRPRIKKTFVVQKKMSHTPLTSRPMATEQCEITIENCCNMNICDTPCFDPKLIQQNLSCDSRTKDDKKILINNMDEDLY